MRGRWPCTAFGRRRGATRAAKRNGGGGEEAGTRKGARTAAATWTGACYPTSPWNSSEFRMSWRRVAYSNSARPCMRNRSRMPPPGTQDTSAYCPGLHRPPPLRTAHPRDRGGRTASCPAILRPPRAFPVRPMRGRCPAAPPRHTRSRGACQNTRGPPRTPPPTQEGRPDPYCPTRCVVWIRPRAPPVRRVDSSVSEPFTARTATALLRYAVPSYGISLLQLRNVPGFSRGAARAGV